jgi:hypothetical protein
VRKPIIAGAMILLVAGLGLGQTEVKLPAPIPLNHLYLVLDSATYKAIEQSPFLRKEFAVTEQRTTTRTDMSYTGLYFYGTNTYFEFFDASHTAVGKLSDSGVAFGVDQAGAMDAIKTNLSAKLSVGESPITRGFQEKQVPWFYMAVPRNATADSGFRFWLMEYHPRFLSEWNAQSDGKNQGVSRRRILERYAAVLKETPANPYFKDVVALTIAVNKQTEQDLIDLCKLWGYRGRVKGITTILEGDDIELRLIPQTAALRGVQEITMRVDRKPEKQTKFRFGSKSVLKFHANGLATWSF